MISAVRVARWLSIACLAPLALTLSGCPTDEDDDPFGDRLPPGEVPGDDDDDDDGGDDDDVWPGPFLSLDPEDEEVNGYVDGESPGSHFGETLLGIGDLDGDGLGEAVVAAPDWTDPDPLIPDPIGGKQGRVYIFYSSTLPDGAALVEEDADVIIRGTLHGGRLGVGLSVIPDISGDGKPELAMGRVPTGAGSASLVFVSQQLDAPDTMDDEDAWWRVQDDVEGTAAVGIQSSAIADLDSDGKPEFAVGASTLGDAQTGRVFIFDGDEVADGGQYAPEDAMITIEGHFPNGYVGEVMANIGDVDGGGRSDLALGSVRFHEGMGENGVVYIFRGEDLASLAATRSTEDAWATITGDAGGDHAGSAACGLGDLDGDGKGEVAFSANLAVGDDATQGRVYIASGANLASGGATMSDVASWIVTGNGKDRLGSSLSCTADIDGDDKRDLLVGAPRHDSPFGDAGQVALYTAADLLASEDADLRLSDASARFAGAALQEQAGLAVAGVPDMDGDRLDDLVIGAPAWDIDAVEIDAGRAYLVLSRYPDPE